MVGAADEELRVSVRTAVGPTEVMVGAAVLDFSILIPAYLLLLPTLLEAVLGVSK